jgi:hypothetical protein
MPALVSQLLLLLLLLMLLLLSGRTNDNRGASAEEIRYFRQHLTNQLRLWPPKN